MKGKVIIVDEAGFISSKQTRDLSLQAERNDNQVILVGDPKQHTSVEAGDAFRAMIKYGNLQIAFPQEHSGSWGEILHDAVRCVQFVRTLQEIEET